MAVLVPALVHAQADTTETPDTGIAWEEKPYQVVDGKVDAATYDGYRRYQSHCHVCHGPAGLGSSYAPGLIDSLAQIGYEGYLEAVMYGIENVTQAQQSVMPAFAEVAEVVNHVDDIYSYLKARADGVIGRRRPERLAGPAPLEENRMICTKYLAAGAIAVALTGGAASGLAQMGELVDRDTLRVCADPNNLPFSNEAGEGFENKIAELLAKDLGVDLAYTWHPQVIGFVRNTLGARACDLVMGIVTTSEVMQNTNPYYRSSYTLVQRADAAARVTSLDDPKLADLRIGAVAQTPPINILAQQNLLKNVTPYHLMVDTRYDNPGRDMVEDVAAGELDVGVLWGPIAGYWAKQQSVPMQVVPLISENAGVRLDFRITMGLRRNEPEWKGILNEFLANHKAEIQEILLDYGVPLLDERGRPIEAAAATQHGALESVPEPAGYRTAEYRAPTPATLRGATVVTTSELQALLAAGAPVLIDVLPAPRPPADRAGARIWRDAARANIPGSVWLPNVGYGELAPEFGTWFQDNLARLSGGDRARRLVFYCQAECWMSWNAARRALALGYRNVVWYPEGTDGWAAAGLPLEAAEPEPMPPFVEIETVSSRPQS